MSRILDLLDAADVDLPPRTGTDRTQIRVATVVRAGHDGRAVTITLLGSGEITLPATSSVWADVRTAWVLMDPDTGRPVHVLGPASSGAPPAAYPGGTLADPATPVPHTVQYTVVPTWASTHRAGRGWDQWLTQYHGGPSDLYQGSSGQSGRLVGMATYAQQIPALVGDGRVTRAVLTLTGTTARLDTWHARVRAATWTEAGPVPQGPVTDPVEITGESTTTVDITPLADILTGVTGAGLTLVGTDYGAVHSVGDSMTIELSCEVTT